MDDDAANGQRNADAARNLARLGAFSEGAPGLLVAAIAAPHAGDPRLPTERAAAVALLAISGLSLWAWRAGEDAATVARDLAEARAAFGEGARAVLVLRPRARVARASLAGEVGASVDGLDTIALLRAVALLAEDALVRGVDVPWSDAAEERAAQAGFVAPPRSP